MPVTVAVDAMGGDHGPSVTLAAALRFLEKTPDARVIAVGLEPRLQEVLSRLESPAKARLALHGATEVVEMHEPPADALRKKKDSSMRVAINLVKDEVAQACVSAGNTGALMAISRFVLKTLPGIDRPAIAAQLPTREGGAVTVLDLGANVNCSPEQLLQFAVMGTALVAAMEHVERPTVGLLNVGEEEIKGNDLAKETGELLRVSGLNFHGNVEGDDIYKGTTQVVICDGFVGNVALKASEGLATMLYEMLRAEFTRNALTRLAAIVAYPVLRAFKYRVRSAPAQRRDADRPQGHGREEPRHRRYAGVRACAAQGVRRGRERRARQDRATDGGDARTGPRAGGAVEASVSNA